MRHTSADVGVSPGGFTSHDGFEEETFLRDRSALGEAEIGDHGGESVGGEGEIEGETVALICGSGDESFRRFFEGAGELLRCGSVEYSAA